MSLSVTRARRVRECPTYAYRGYGLNICSALPLLGLDAADESADDADVQIRLGRVNDSPPGGRNKGHWVLTTGGAATMFSERFGAFLVKDGREMVVDPSPGVDQSLLCAFVRGPAFAVLLYQRGRLTLHASAVAMSGGAVVFLGRSGAGKSTIARALHKRGHDIVADDIVAVQTNEKCPVVFPGFPILRLYPEVAGWQEEEAEMKDRKLPDKRRRACPITRGFARDPVPLTRVYLLDDGDENWIEPLRPSQAILEFARYTFVQPRQAEAARSHFRQCELLARDTSMRRLHRRRLLTRLQELVRVIQDDVVRDG